LSKLLVNPGGACYAFRSLALAALHFDDEDVFWQIVNSSQFHQVMEIFLGIFAMQFICSTLIVKFDIKNVAHHQH
jgi:hypothetical protein